MITDGSQAINSYEIFYLSTVYAALQVTHETTWPSSCSS